MMKPEDIKQIGTNRLDLKKQFLLEMEAKDSHIDPDLTEGTINCFIYIDKSEGAFLTLRNWIMYVNSINDTETVPYVPLVASQSQKSKILSDYSHWLSRKSKLPEKIMEEINEEEQKAINNFVKTDLSTDLYELIKEWEVQIFNTYTVDKKHTVIKFINQYKIK